jgi:ribosomal protein L16 Arg81 hydroxylase
MNEKEEKLNSVFSVINDEVKIIQEILDARQNQNFQSEFSNTETKTYQTIVKQNLNCLTDEVFNLYKAGFIPLTPIQIIDLDGKPYLCQTVLLTKNQLCIHNSEIDSENLNSPIVSNLEY